MSVDRILEIVRGIEAFAGRVDGALDLARLQRQNQLPQTTPAAFVIPAGLMGRDPDTVTGLYRQTYIETVAVVIVLRHHDDPRATRSGDVLNGICWDVIGAVAGVEFGETCSQAVFRRGGLVSLTDGAAVYQLEFALQDQMRIQR